MNYNNNKIYITTISNLLSKAIICIGTVVFSFSKSTFLNPILEKNSILSFISPTILRIIVIIIVAIVVRLIISLYYECKFLFQGIKNKYTMLNQSGLFYFRKNRVAKDIETNEKLLLKNTEGASIINIIGATGYNTFARNDEGHKATLRKIFETTNSPIRILLLHPHSDQVKIRARKLRVDLNDYRIEIFRSINFLRELKNEGKDISLKFYSQKPIWKIIILDNFMWLQYYNSKKHVETVPVFGIQNKNEDEFNFFHPLREVFKKKWSCDNNPKYNFSTGEIEYNEKETLSWPSLRPIELNS